jgi:hypothetical protein
MSFWQVSRKVNPSEILRIYIYFLLFLQTSSGMFGLGHTQTRCVKTISTVPLPDNLKNSIRSPKLVWTGSRNVSLMLADGSENRYGC